MNAKTTLHIFKPGKQTAMSGLTLEFSEADLAACAQAYDPAVHEAPIVIGHPRHDLPAYGWVQSLAFGEDGLHAAPHQVDTAFAELVEAGRYKKISASFYTPDAPNNPVPGVYYLRHVGFLGAQPPAVKGLKAVEFADAEEGVVSFGELSPYTVSRLFRGLRDFILTQFGQETADRVLPPYDVDWLQEQAAQPAPQESNALSVGFTEPLTPESVSPNPEEPTVDPAKAAALESENQTLKAEITAFKAQAKADAEVARHTGNVAYAEGLVGAGTLAPVHQAAVVALLDFAGAPDAEGGVVEFGEGEAKQPLVDGLKGFLDGLPKVVALGELATKDKAGTSGAGDTVDYGENVDQDRLALDQRIRAYATEHQVDYATAASRVIK